MTQFLATAIMTALFSWLLKGSKLEKFLREWHTDWITGIGGTVAGMAAIYLVIILYVKYCK